MKGIKRWIAILASMVAVACATQGPPVKITETLSNGIKYTIVAHPQSVPDWMLDGNKLKLNFVVFGELTQNQLNDVAKVEGSCRLYAGTVRPSNLVLVATNTALYALVGYVGVGYGAKLAFTGAKMADYGKYGAAATGLAGGANGIITLGGRTYTFENCGREILAKVHIQVLQKSPY